MKHQHIVVIGGGASGLLAAIIAKRGHAKVTILERNPKLGKKILATGNGRCNYTNQFTKAEHYNHPAFVEHALDVFGAKKTIQFFEKLGISPRIEDLGKAYPMSEQASSIVDVLVYETEQLGIDVLCNAKVVHVQKVQNQFITTLSEGQTIKSDKVILATGGKAMPGSGSDGNGYQIAESFGHHITHLFPSLVKLKLNSPYLKSMDGVKIQGTVQLLDKNQVIQTEKGDVLFTSYGISGPTILQVSRKANEMLSEHLDVKIKVILLDQMTKEDIERRFQLMQDKPLDVSLVGLIHKKIIPAIIKEAGIQNPSIRFSLLTPKEKGKLASLMLDWRFTVVDSKGYEDAQVTAGGVNIDEINPLSMESRLVSGLYMTGEILDIDGLCGGYNLQWAWSSAYLAGKHASI
jgi:hypothetical protein